MGSDSGTRMYRKKGQGGLRRLDGDRWQVSGRVDGRQVTRVFTAPNQTAAERQAPAVLAQAIEERKAASTAKGYEAHERSLRQAWTVSQYADFYLVSWAAEHLAHTTRRRYEQIIKQHVKPHIGQIKMGEVTETDLQRLYRLLGSDGARKRGGGGPLSGPSIWTVHNVIRAMFSFAVEIQHDFAVNPAAGKAARPKCDRTGASKRAVDVAEVERFVALAAEQAPRIAVPVMLSAYLGTRRSETLALRWADVDYDSATVTIQRSVTETPKDGVIIKETTKTHKNRYVPLDSHTLANLKEIQKTQRQARLRLGKAWEGAEKAANDYICATPTGALLSPSVFEAAFRNFAESVGIAMTPHLLRHAFVTQLIALDYDAVTISAMTGHSPDVLLKTYAHAFDGRKREAVDKLGETREAARAAL